MREGKLYALLRERTPVRRAALLMTCADSTDEAAEAAVAMFRKICVYQKWEEAGIVVAPGLHRPDEIDGREELDLAKRLGQEI